MERLMRRLNGSLSRSVRRSVQDVFQQSPLDLRFALQKTLDPRVTFTRASSGTYVDSQGVIRTATTNLLLRSEELATSPWFNAGVTLTNNSTDVLDPFGGTKSTKIVATGSSSAVGQGATIATASTGSIWLRTSSGTASFSLIIYLSSSPFTNIGTANITVTTAWQRFSVTSSTPPAQASYNFQLQAIPAATLYAFGAQLEQSSTVGEYIPTTSTINSAPRFDHNPTTGESLGLLVEESRTNYILYSEAILSNAVSGPNRTITENAEVSPDGATTAASVTATGTDPYVVINTATGVPAGTYTLSVYLKGHPSNSSQECKLRIQDAGSGLQTSAAFTITTDWQRYNFTVTTTGNLQNVRLDIPDVAVSGDIVYVWGLQIEAGSFPTSYIPTAGTTVTRAADVASITGSNFSSWYRQDEGSNLIVFTEPVARTDVRTPRSVNDGTVSNRIDGFLATNFNHRFVVSGSAFNSSSLVFAVSPNINAHIQAAKAGSAIGCLNGMLSTEAAPTIMPVIDRLTIGRDSTNGTPFTGHIRRFTYWPQRLPNSTLQQITQ